MKTTSILAALAGAFLAGCSSSPYDYSENWLFREDATCLLACLTNRAGFS